MSLPGDLTLITVTGTYVDANGSALAGSVTFTPTTDLQDSTGHVVLRAAPLTVLLSNGAFSITLPCTDNATITPSSWAYTVAEALWDGPQSLTSRNYTVQLPHTLGSTVDITNVAPVNPPTPYSPYYGVLTASNTWVGALNAFSGEVTVQAPTNPSDAATKAYVDAHAGVASVNGHTGTVVLSSTDVGAVPESAVTTKGDILAATGTSTVTRLAAGSDGQVLAADSTQTTGLRWIAPPAGGVTSVNSHTGAVTLAAADVGALATTQNLADVGSAASARTNLGLGNAAVANIGTAAGTVAAGNDTRILGAVQASTVTAKGDLLVATGAGTVVRQAVGTDGQVLTAASGQADGLTWATPASPRDPYAAKLGLVAQPFPIETVSDTGLGLTAGFLILALIRPGAATINNLGLWLGGQGSGATGVSSMALFDEAGNQLAVTGDMTAALSNAANAGTYVEAAVGTPYVTADATNYYVGVLCQMSSNPTIAGTFYMSGLHIPTIKGHRPSIVVGGQSSMPASFSVSGATTGGAGYWLVAS